MRILFVVPYVPSRIKIRPYNFIKGLTNNGHEVTVATLWSTEQDREDLKALEGACHRVVGFELTRLDVALSCLKALPSKWPLQAAYSYHPRAARVLRRMVTAPRETRFDVVHVEHLRAARYAIELQSSIVSHRIHLPLVWDSVDSITELFRRSARHSISTFGRWIPRLELPRTEALESELATMFSSVLVTTKQDASALRELASSPKAANHIRVVPNGIDLEYFSPAPLPSRDPNRLVMTGKMSYHANITMAVSFVHQMWPELRRRHPGLKLWIVGKDPSREILALGQSPGVEVTGTVEDMRPYLWGAAVAVAPLVYAVGIQNKVLEAMATGTATVVSPAGAAGLDLEPGSDAIVSALPQEFVEAVDGLLSNRAQRVAVGDGGRRFVERFHDWRSITAQLEEVYDELTVAHS